MPVPVVLDNIKDLYRYKVCIFVSLCETSDLSFFIELLRIYEAYQLTGWAGGAGRHAGRGMQCTRAKSWLNKRGEL